MSKIKFIVDLDVEELKMLSRLSKSFNLPRNEVISFLIFKSFYLLDGLEFKEKSLLASQIEVNET